MGQENSQPVFFEPKRGGRKGTHKENVLKRYNLKDEGYSLDELAKISSVPLDILQQVYNRGIGAYKTQPKSVRLEGSFVKNVDAPLSKKLSKEQWAMARVYSFLDGNPAHDDDLRSNKVGRGKKSEFTDTPMKLLELFKGTGSVGKVAKKLGYDVVSLDFEEKYKPDILTDILKWNYKDFPTPDYIWASPPCNTFSGTVYPLKERNPETAEPYSERAKLGTKILYQTLKIIKYFLNKNPKLKFCIENPHGMMRKDPKMRKLPMETTRYCMYGDEKTKPTDFWSNYPLDLKQGSCIGTVRVQEAPCIEQRYRMPPKLIRQILLQAQKEDNVKVGLGKGKKSEFTDTPVSELPEPLQEVIADPLDDSEIRHYLPNAKIIKYSELAKYKAITQLLPNETDYCIILYEDSPNNGHWVALLRYNKGKKGTIEFFDPYGNMFDKQLDWTSLENRKKLGQGRKLLTPLLDCALQTIVYNPIKYQQDGGEINDCGRHCVFRIKCLLDKGMDLDDYFEYMKQLEKEMRLPPDGIVSSQIDLCM
jgi:hypothetical protein